MKSNKKNAIYGLVMVAIIMTGAVIGARVLSLDKPTMNNKIKDDNPNSDVSTPTDLIIVDENYYQEAPRDPNTINSVELEEDILKLSVSYGGGCKEHEFALIITNNFMESNPVQINVLLSHNANDDLCEAYLTEELLFDLTPLKETWQQTYQQESGTIIIWLDGLEESIVYDF